MYSSSIQEAAIAMLKYVHRAEMPTIDVRWTGQAVHVRTYKYLKLIRVSNGEWVSFINMNEDDQLQIMNFSYPHQE